MHLLDSCHPRQVTSLGDREKKLLLKANQIPADSGVCLFFFFFKRYLSLSPKMRLQHEDALQT